MKQITLGDINIRVTQKHIKNVHLSVYPPSGGVRISAPEHMALDTIRLFAISKLSWIKKQQKKFHNQVRETPREYINRESHYYLGKRYLLKVIEHDTPVNVIKKHEFIELYIRPNTSKGKRKEILEEWYRQELKKIIPPIIKHYEKEMALKVNEFGIKKMRTKWGTCNSIAKRIWLNLDLAKKEKEYIEYIVVHEMVHLLERKHNNRFTGFMDKYMPKWRFYKEGLNRTQLKNENWQSE